MAKTKPYVPIKLNSEDLGKDLLIEYEGDGYSRISLKLEIDDCHKGFAKQFGRIIQAAPRLLRAALDILKAVDTDNSDALMNAIHELRTAVKMTGIKE